MSQQSMASEAIVHVVDDDDAVRDAVVFQLQTAGYDARGYDCAEAFLQHPANFPNSCILTDVRMPGLSGLELVHRLSQQGSVTPVIIMTGHGDVPLAVEAMKSGVVDFIEKPFEDDVLLRAIAKALASSATAHDETLEREASKARFAQLSPRELDVLAGVVAGKPNKVIAFDLGISPRTVEVYRSGLMSKTGAATLSELIRMALRLGL